MRAGADLVDRIDGFAPPELHDARRGLWRKLRHALRGVGCKDADDVVDMVLRAVVVAHLGEEARSRERRARRSDDWYWRAKVTVEEQVAKLREHPIVRAFPFHAVEYFEPDEVRCPHGRHRKKCEGIRRRLEDLMTLREPAPKMRVLVRRVAELRHELHSANVDADLRKPDEFCSPLPAARYKRWTVPIAARGGRPVDELRRYLMLTVIGRLTESGLSVEKSFEYLQSILAFCFGRQVDAATLERQWRRLPRGERLGVGPPRRPPGRT